MHPDISPSFCPFCGGPLSPGGDGSTYACARCARTTYLNSKPSACAVIVRGGQVLLINGEGVDSASWDVPGGFLLYGESPEDGLKRELREELNAEIEVKYILAALVDVYGPLSEFCLNIFFRASLLSQELRPGDDVRSFGWFGLEELPALKYESTRRVLSRLDEYLRSDI